MKKQLGKILGTLVDGIFYPLNTIQAIAAAIANRNASLTFGQKYQNELERIYKEQGLKEFDAARRKDRKGFLADIALTAAIIGMFNIGGKELPEPVTPSPTGVVSTEPEEHKITIYFHAKEGDWLNKISHATGVYIRDIEEQNPVLKTRGLWAGDILEIEVLSSKLPEIIAGQANDGLNGKFYLTYDAAKLESNILYYTVGKGDFLQDIADAFGVNMDDVMIENNIQNEDYIQAGSVLKITNPMPKYELSTILKKFHLSGTIDFNEKTQIYVSNPIETQPKETPSTTNLAEGHQKILDFSGLAGEIDWDKLEASYKRGEFSGVILRMAENSISSETGTFAFTLDKQFERNIQEANKRGIRYGAYVFTRAKTPDGIINQAEAASAYLKELETRGIYFRPSLPIYGDFWEHDAKTQMSLYNERKYEECVNLMVSFCDVLERDGWFTGIYANNKILDDILVNAPNAHLISNYTQWRAAYGSNPKGPIAEIGYNNKVKLDFIKAIVQVAQYGEVDFTKSYVDVNIATEELMETVRNYYINKYGADYYSVNSEPTLSASVNYGFKATEIESETRTATLQYALNNANYQQKLAQDGFCLIEETGMEVSCHVGEDGQAIYWVGEAIESPSQYHERLKNGHGRYLAPPQRRDGARI